MKRSVLIAGVIAVAVVGWVLSGQLGRVEDPAVATPSARDQAGDDAATLISVRVAEFTAQPRPRRIVVNGRTEAFRTVDIRAETYGRVEEILARRGDILDFDDVLGRLALDDRSAKMAEAEALLRQREIEHTAAERLQTKGFRSETSLAQAKAQLDAALAVVEQMRVDIERATLRAPFSGVIQAGHIEVGDYLEVGEVAGTIVDLDPILVVGYATEREVSALEIGAVGSARLLDGTEVEGIIGFVSPTADGSTRTYRFELEVANPDFTIRDGATSRIVIEADAEAAHFISPSILTLTDDGAVGVKVVNAADEVEFHPVTLLQDLTEGVWIGGLPATVRVITVGQEFVVEGQRVMPVLDEAITPAPPGGIS